jgi:hypothetical protein
MKMGMKVGLRHEITRLQMVADGAGDGGGSEQKGKMGLLSVASGSGRQQQVARVVSLSLGCLERVC